MLVLDELKLFVGLPLTSARENDLGANQLRGTLTAARRTASEHADRLTINQSEHDAGRLDLKGAGTAFTTTPEKRTAAHLHGDVRQLQSAISIAWRQRKAQRKAIKNTQRTTIAEAKTACRRALSQAKQSFQKAIESLLPVEVQARELAQQAYTQAVASAKSGLTNATTSAAAACGDALAATNKTTQENVVAMEARITTLRDEVVALRIDPKFQRIDMGFLCMRKKSGPDSSLPLFAVFTDKKSDFTLTLHCVKPRGTEISDTIETLSCSSPCSTIHYEAFRGILRKAVDVYLDKLHYRRDRWTDTDLKLTMSAQFAGVIPMPVRERIKHSRQFFDEILIVSEAPEWSLVIDDIALRRVPVGDPLVIGRKGTLFWLIDSFDTTSAEEHVRREFTSDIVK